MRDIEEFHHMTVIREPISHLLAGFEELDDYYNRNPHRHREALNHSIHYRYIKQGETKEHFPLNLKQ